MLLTMSAATASVMLDLVSALFAILSEICWLPELTLRRLLDFILRVGFNFALVLRWPILGIEAPKLPRAIQFVASLHRRPGL